VPLSLNHEQDKANHEPDPRLPSLIQGVQG
jgi:hypothetical protein